MGGFRTVVGGAVYLNKMGKMQVKKKKKAFFWEGRKGDFNLVKKARRCLKVKIIMTNIYWDLIR